MLIVDDCIKLKLKLKIKMYLLNLLKPTVSLSQYLSIFPLFLVHNASCPISLSENCRIPNFTVLPHLVKYYQLIESYATGRLGQCMECVPSRMLLFIE